MTTQDKTQGRALDILIVDDTPENLDAAREAVEEGDHPIEIGRVDYLDNAGDALEAIEAFDGLVTDFMFRGGDERVHSLYKKYLEEIRACDIYDYSYQRGRDKKLDFLSNGRVSESEIEKYIEFSKKKVPSSQKNLAEAQEKGDQERIDLCKESLAQYEKELVGLKSLLEHPPEPEFAYGGPLMLRADEHSLPFVLITNLHRHACGSPLYGLRAGLDGFTCLSPLLRRGLITSDQVAKNGEGSKIYVGRQGGGIDKDSPEPWKLAIEKLVSQIKPHQNP